MKKIIRLLIFLMVFVLASCGDEEPTPNAPSACFTVPSVMTAGVAVDFNSSCSENAASYAWDFGDGGTSTLANPSHTYSAGGNYEVTLTVTSSESETDQTSKNIVVAEAQAMEHSGDITADETWIEGIHLIVGDVYVDDCILTIQPGAIIRVNQGYGIYFGYNGGVSGTTLIANGTAAKPITITSSAATKAPGDWDFIGFYEGTSSATSMQYCTVEYGGGYSTSYGEIHLNGVHISITNSTIQFSEQYGISLSSGAWFGAFSNNTLKDNATYPIDIYGNYVHTIGTGNTITTNKGVLVEGDDFEQASATWLDLGCPYIIASDIYIQSVTGSILTIQPGVEIQLTENTGIYIAWDGDMYGTLIADGTAQNRIKFTSAAPAGSKTAGDWDFIGFYSGAGHNSSFSYCDIEYGGGYSTYTGEVNIDESAVSFEYCNITNSETYGITTGYEGYFTSCENNTFEDNASYPIQVYANWAHTIGAGNTFNTGPGIQILGDDIDQDDATWLKHGIPYIVVGDIDLGSTTGAKLTIQAGTTLKFAEGAEFLVAYAGETFGTLIAEGTSDNKITFTSAAPAGFENPGDWHGLFFYDGTGSPTILDYCNISFGGGYSAYSGNLNIENSVAGVPTISNCYISDSENYGIYLGNDADPTLTSNTFSNNAMGDMNVK
jgi:parallel beta-helix repeat protein